MVKSGKHKIKINLKSNVFMLYKSMYLIEIKNLVNISLVYKLNENKLLDV